MNFTDTWADGLIEIKLDISRRPCRLTERFGDCTRIRHFLRQSTAEREHTRAVNNVATLVDQLRGADPEHTASISAPLRIDGPM